MATHYNFGYQVTKVAPYKTDSLGNGKIHAAWAMIQAAASDPKRFYNLGYTDKWYFTSPTDKEVYLIERTI